MKNHRQAIFLSVNKLWGLFNQVVKLSDKKYQGLIEQFLDEKARIHDSLCQLALKDKEIIWEKPPSATQANTQTRKRGRIRP